jgi:lipopolysaccharide biosynthesis glycosyltransferase
MKNKLTPKFDENNIAVVLCTDDNYAKYCAVSIQSIIEKANKKNNYDIIIFDGGISEQAKKKNALMIKGLKNFSIRYVNVEKLLEDVDMSVFFVDQWFSIAAYYRIFIPRAVSKYEKILYMDCDIVLNDDIAKAYNIDLDGKIAGVVTECVIEYLINQNPKAKDFHLDTLGLKKPQQYFNSGFMLLNVKRMQEEKYEQKIIDATRVFTPQHVDQDLFNYVFKNDIKFLDMKYNFMCGLLSANIDFYDYLSEETYFEYMKSHREAKVIHYTGSLKPWHKKDLIFHDLWWLYAKNTPFIKEINQEYRKHRGYEDQENNTKPEMSNNNVKLVKKKFLGVVKITKRNKVLTRVKILGITIYKTKG